jgi:hypothetical protein
LSEVSGRREVVVEPAVGDEERVSARQLPLDDATHVNPAFADDEAAEFDDDLRIRQGSSRLFRHVLQVSCDGLEIERRSPWKIGNAEAATDVDDPHRRRADGKVSARSIVCRWPRKSHRAKVLRTAEDVKPSNAKPCRPIDSSASGTHSASIPNCFGPPLIFMPDDFNSKSGLTRTATRAGGPLSLTGGQGCRFRASTRR